MKKRTIIPIIIMVSIFFNIGFAVYIQTTDSSTSWLFREIGPAIMQDSYYIRSPVLESPFGMIGDIPGGYPLYSGNPLQSGLPENYSTSSEIYYGISRFVISQLGAILLAITFSVIPVGFIVIIGRKSYGSTKTQ